MDVKCLICGEPWDYWGLYHGDVQAWEADAIRDGRGCPACHGHSDEGYQPTRLSDFEWGDEDCLPRIYAHARPVGKYEPPPVEVLEACIGCGIQRVRDRSAEVYNGKRREPVYAWYAPVGSDASRWGVGWKLSCEDPGAPMMDFHGLGPVCQHCCDECAECDALIATHCQGTFASLDGVGEGYLPEGCYSTAELRCLDCYCAYESEWEGQQ